MADVNKVILIGRLTRDVETRSFANTGGKVAKFGLAVAYMRDRKDPNTGEWGGGETTFIDIEVFNRETRQLADLVESRLRKGSQVYVEGRLRLNKWTDKEGQERQKLLVVADTVEFLDPRENGMGDGGSRTRTTAQSASSPRKPSAPAPKAPVYEEERAPMDEEQPQDDIPF
jgi:single-strand DNA-binding protein